MSVVEREIQLNVLRAMLADCVIGKGSVVLVDGAPASGKSVLLEIFSMQSNVGEVAFMQATASSAERGMQLEVVRQLFDSFRLPENAAVPVEARQYLFLPEEWSRKIEYASTESVVPDNAREVWRRLWMTSNHIPLIIIIDDFQFVDKVSLQCLLYISRRLSSAKIMLVLSGTLALDPEHSRFQAELTRLAFCREIRLDMLSLCGVESLIASELGGAEACRFAPVYLAASGGNPLLVQALLNDRDDEGAASAVAGEKFRQAVLACLDRCGSTVLETARARALLGSEVSGDAVGKVAGLTMDEVCRATVMLEKTGLLDQGGFRHDQISAAIIAATPECRRAVMHERAAYLLYSEGSSAMIVARHLMGSTGAVNESMVAVLKEAAQQAVATGEPQSAVEFLRLAEKACPDDASKAEIISRIIQVGWCFFPDQCQRHFADTVVSLRDFSKFSASSVKLVGILLWYGRAADAIAVMEGFREGGERISKESASASALQFAVSFLYPECFPVGAKFRQEIYSADLAGMERPESRQFLRAMRLLSSFLEDPTSSEIVDNAEQILEGISLGCANVMPAIIALIVLIQADKIGCAATWSDIIHQSMGSHCGPMRESLLSAIRAWIAYRQGRLSDADQLVNSGLSQVSPEGWGIAIGVPLAVAMLTATAKGDYQGARRHLEVPVPDAMFQTPVGLYYLCARGEYSMATGRFRAALADFSMCAEIESRWELSGMLPLRTMMAQALLNLDRTADANRLLRDELADARKSSRTRRAVASRVLATCSEPRDRVPVLRECARVFEQSGRRLELAMTTADLVDALYAIGETGEARIVSRRAYRLAAECGAESLMRRLGPGRVAPPCGKLAGDADIARPTRFSQLSDAERRVAELVVEGFSNRQIAKRLCLTVSTVEQHLTRIYKKLSVPGRSALVGAAAVSLLSTEQTSAPAPDTRRSPCGLRPESPGWGGLGTAPLPDLHLRTG